MYKKKTLCLWYTYRYGDAPSCRASLNYGIFSSHHSSGVQTAYRATNGIATRILSSAMAYCQRHMAFVVYVVWV